MLDEKKMKETVALFGTCNGIRWRDRFEAEFSKRDIPSYNPMIMPATHGRAWEVSDADEEAEMLVSAGIILFPVLRDTLGTGSLAETGFSLLSAIRADAERYVVVLVDDNVDQKYHEMPETLEAAKESVRARKLVRAHLKKVKYPNVFFVQTLDEMLEVSLELHKALKITNALRERFGMK